MVRNRMELDSFNTGGRGPACGNSMIKIKYDYPDWLDKPDLNAESLEESIQGYFGCNTCKHGGHYCTRCDAVGRKVKIPHMQGPWCLKCWEGTEGWDL